MPQPGDSAPFVELFVFFLTIVFVRTQITYWLARAVANQTMKRTHDPHSLLTRSTRWMHGPRTTHGMVTVRRWGPLAVFLSFFATGTKTILNAAAGLIRMPFGIYLPAMVLGCIAHSLIYSLVGWAAWVAAVQAAAGSPLGLALFILALITIIAVIIMKRRRLDTARSTPPRG